jgi:hypothetical protein
MRGMKWRFPVRYLLWAPVIVATVAVLSPLMPTPFVRTPQPLLLFVSAGCFALWIWSLAYRPKKP